MSTCHHVIMLFHQQLFAPFYNFVIFWKLFASFGNFSQLLASFGIFLSTSACIFCQLLASF